MFYTIEHDLTQEDFAKFFVGETAIAIREAVGL